MALPIYIAEDATVEGVDIAGVAKTFDQARKTVDAYAPILNATFEKKYGARAMNYYIWPSQMFYCNSAIKGLADIKGKKVRVQGTSQGDLVEALGGTGVTIPFAEVVPALQRGTVDCGITGTMPAYKAGWHEVTSHVLTCRSASRCRSPSRASTAGTSSTTRPRPSSMAPSRARPTSGGRSSSTRTRRG